VAAAVTETVTVTVTGGGGPALPRVAQFRAVSGYARPGSWSVRSPRPREKRMQKEACAGASVCTETEALACAYALWLDI